MATLALLRSLATVICVGTCTIADAAEAGTSAGVPMPAEFRDNRVFLVVPDANGPPLVFYTDSGGGFNAIAASTAERLGLRRIGTLPGEVGQVPLPLVQFPPALTAAGVPVSDYGGPFQGGLVAVPDADLPFGHDGFLGGRWFDGHVWAFDYVARTLRLLDGVPPPASAHWVPLGFQTDPGGRRTTAFARLAVTIDGESLDMLLDTGATMTLTARSAPAFGRDRGARVGGSFIVQSVFARWIARHPNWRVIQEADAVTGQSASMIEVPTVSIGGLTVGPVWFAVRPDSAFRAYMASTMDRPIDGAVGGSVFRHLRMTIDYPHAVVAFARPSASR